MALEITISPVDEDWLLTGPQPNETMQFSSGARAEAVGRALAARTALAGFDVELVIILRGGQIAARLPFRGQAAA